MFLAAVMLLSLVPATAYAEGYKAEITFIREDTNQTVTKTFTDPEEKLGFNGMATNDGGVYFMGWSPNKQLTVEKDELYFAHEKVGDLFPNGTTEPATLYAQHASMLWAGMLAQGHSIGINEILSAEETLPGTEIKSVEGKTITAYYDHKKDPGYDLKLLANFKFNPMAAYYAYLNPHAMVRSYDNFDDIANDTMKAKLPKFTHVDLHVKLDKRIKLANSANVAFSSTTFVPLAYEKDADPYDLLARISHDENSKKQKVTITNVPTASYETAEEGTNELMLRTGLRRHWKGHYVIPNLKASEVKEDMTLSTPDTGAFTILKDYARAIADGTANPIEVGGHVDGYIVGPSYSGLSLSFEIDPINASPLKIGFVHPEVTFVPQTPGKTGEANIVNKIVGGTSHNFKEDGITNPEFPKVEPSEVVVDGATYLFKGWNTQKDGKGDWFTADTDVRKDMTVYAIWEPQPEPKPEPKPDNGGMWILPGGGKKEEATEDHIAYIFGYPDKSVRPEGNLTRAEAAAMVTRLGRLDLSDTSKAAYPDLKDGAWYLPYINAALKAGMLDTDEAGNLRPDAPVTRGEFVKMIAAIDRPSEGKAPFTDIAGHKYEKEINQVYGNRRAIGYEDGTFKPDSTLTRAESAAFLNRVFNRVADDVAVGGFEARLAKFTDLQKGTWFYYELVEATNSHQLVRRGGQDDLARDYERWTNLWYDKVAK